jgi:hypothetical protein
MNTLIIEEKQSRNFSFRESLVEFLKMNLAIKPLQYIYKRSAEKTMLELKSLPEK